MIKFAVRGLLARKLRTILTALGVVLGVALVSGTYVLTDSISTAFDSIFKQTYKNTDVAVTGKPAFSGGDQGNGTNSAPSFDEAVLNRITALPDVNSAVGQVQGDAHLIGHDGKAITFGGAPNLGFSVDPAKPEFNTLTLVSGAWPQPGEVVIDRGTADKKNFAVGQTHRSAVPWAGARVSHLRTGELRRRIVHRRCHDCRIRPEHGSDPVR